MPERACTFPLTFNSYIKTANDAGTEPTMISVGIDEWACHPNPIQPWLNEAALSFALVMQAPMLLYGLSEKYYTFRNNAYWRNYQAKEILDGMAVAEDERPEDKYQNLLAAWDQVQRHKSVRNEHPVVHGRNRTAAPTSILSSKHPLIESAETEEVV
ncbi:hypothetical protein BU24DRAFT_411671 [Aaosphaeria arxii CBS 175.79]|uniref:Uncharacterized protein n=1 Tax=Aaosphaeria arxii CBS 175.79 TaxID=1450172 RepID=A0A6A5XM13_9PLEO|nr:uncharacterized protein BU24DRAFT_411671 [Aaosphaeria arxii CBS 175.79]KAF2013983.1 hypothetical protein BU24DRAFT_411671 [Aaosphaeria arxii CBS 175.79]